MEKAIRKAIEGGYKIEWSMDVAVNGYYRSHILLDPLFWQALGKAEGWDDSKPYINKFCKYDNCYEDVEYDVELFKSERPEIWSEIKDGKPFDSEETTYKFCSSTPDWKINWLDFIRWIAEGGTVDDFFNQLLT